jgi:hypothetical protein
VLVVLPGMFMYQGPEKNTVKRRKTERGRDAMMTNQAQFGHFAIFL